MIKTIKWKNNDVLGNLQLNFTKPDGTAYNTIVIAGENGAGKTTVLETVSTFLNLGTIEPFEEIIYEVNGTEYSICPAESNANLGFHKRKNIADGTETKVNSNRNNNFATIASDDLDIRHYGCAYTKARSGFSTQPIKSSTTQQLDDNKYEDDKADDFTRIKQLLIDIKFQDNSAWDKECAKGGGMTYAQFQSTSKTHRFQNAFNAFFNSLTYDGIDIESKEEIKVVFTKNSKLIPIDRLSTGEKQIVFRGAYLLKNSNNLDGGIVLVDEPELSMHPKWQEKIFDYYRGLFKSGDTQSAQMIFATHSEYVIRSALKDPNNVLVIILTDENGTIKGDKINDVVLPNLNAAEVNYLAFGVKSIDYHIALYGDLQAQTGNSGIQAIDSYIESQPEYSATLHEKIDTTHGHYKTWPTYIRNAIDHPDSGRSYSETDMALSIELLRALCKRHRGTP